MEEVMKLDGMLGTAELTKIGLIKGGERNSKARTIGEANKECRKTKITKMVKKRFFEKGDMIC